MPVNAGISTFDHTGDLPAMELLANYRPVVDYCLCTSDEDPSIYSGDGAASPILFLARTGETPAKFILPFGARIGQRKSRHISFQLPSNFGFHVNFWVEKPSSRISAGIPEFLPDFQGDFRQAGLVMRAMGARSKVGWTNLDNTPWTLSFQITRGYRPNLQTLRDRARIPLAGRMDKNLDSFLGLWGVQLYSFRHANELINPLVTGGPAKGL